MPLRTSGAADGRGGLREEILVSRVPRCVDDGQPDKRQLFHCVSIPVSAARLPFLFLPFAPHDRACATVRLISLCGALLL